MEESDWSSDVCSSDLVTHEPDIAAYAGRVIEMRDGRVRSDERRTPLRAEPEPAEPADAGEAREALP